MSSEVISVRGVSKSYILYGRPIDRLKHMMLGGDRFETKHALQDVSLTVHKGETVGIIGRNGSGKSTLLQIICGTLNATSGSVEVHGRLSALLELGAGFNPEFTGLENMQINGAILGMSPEEIAERRQEIIDFSGIGDAVQRPVKTYSSGMMVRLAFAISAVCEPDILVVDEALAVGDEAFQRKCFARIRELQSQGCSILFVSHSGRMITELCDRCIVMEAGEKIAEGEAKPMLGLYQKLIYAPVEQQAKLAKQIQSGDVQNESEIEQSQLRPESTLHYVSHGAEIRNPRVTDAKGNVQAILKRGKQYRFRYEVHFKKAAYKVRCGMMIKLMSGIELGGASIVPEAESIEAIEAGKILQVRFRFSAHLMPGTYFMNCGCSGEVNGERTFLHRILDACMFKVEDDDPKRTGIVDFDITSEYDYA